MDEARRALQGLPYRLENLEGAGVLRRAGEQYRIAYMVLSVDDQRAISVASEPHGRSLAATFVAAAPRYQRLFARYPYVELRNDLGFVTVAGYTLNWDGLRIGTDRPGLVAATTTQINSTFDDILRLNGEIMLALRAGPKTAVQLQQQTGGSALRVSQAIDVLLASSYLREKDEQQRYSAAVLVLREEDRPMLDEARQLGREILTDWLKDNYGKIKRDLTGLDVSHVGFVPVVFQADLVAMP